MKMKSPWLIAILASFILPACRKEKVESVNSIDSTGTLNGTGWNSRENYSQNIPVSINIGTFGGGGVLPSSVDLTAQFPPVNYQGDLGTCVAWAVGYNIKSYLDGVRENLAPGSLMYRNKQYSPTDLFFSIDPSKRSCSNGTSFEDAFNVLVNRGAHKMDYVPYEDRCLSGSPASTAPASANRIKNYRRIDGSVDQIKGFLANGTPVVLGAKVNAAFKAWRGSGVLQDLNYTGNNFNGHAMVIAGYDDGRNAFRIINSWGSSWGDNGYAWVDYNFLVNKFCVQDGKRSLFVAYNDNNIVVNPPNPGGSMGPDLNAVVLSDFSMYPSYSSSYNARSVGFDVKNIGNEVIPASSNWNIYYLWVNAFNANDYGVIFRGEFTTGIPANTYQNITANYSRINYDLSPGASLAQTIFRSPYISWNYYMPGISGNYYLVLYLDKGNSNEYNQTNNVFYVTQSPKYFSNGYSQKSRDLNTPEGKYGFTNMSSFRHELPAGESMNEFKLAPYRTLSNAEFPNAYSSEEIVSFLKFKIKNGGL